MLEQTLSLSVTDDGRGFEPDARAPSGLGLLTMRDYVDAMGGTLSITSFPGEGTGVEVVIPFDYVELESPAEPDDGGAIGFVLNMHWAKPSGLPVRDPDVDPDVMGNDEADEADLPHAIGQ